MSIHFELQQKYFASQVLTSYPRVSTIISQGVLGGGKHYINAANSVTIQLQYEFDI